MTLHLYDSLRRSVVPVEPLTPGQLSLYVCGPTVYGPIHVGNARPFVVAMTLARHLRRTGWQVKVVSNLTDINDKIYTAAVAEGIESALHRRHHATWSWATRCRAEGDGLAARDHRHDRAADCGWACLRRRW